MTRAIVIGAGPAGLACAACLKRDDIKVEILERATRIGSSWHGHYDGLHLHTVRSRSALPYMPMPKTGGKFPSRIELIAYLDAYAQAFDLTPRFGTTVHRVLSQGPSWTIEHSLGTSQADVVIFATGLNGTPRKVTFKGSNSFLGPQIHSSTYKSAQPFAGQSVLVVGFGNSGGDIALDLAQNGANPTLSVRGPVNILPKSLFGIPVTSLGGMRKLLPYKWVDAMTAPILRAKIGRPEDYGLQSANKGPAAQVIEEGRVPLIDAGTLAAIKAGLIAVRPGIKQIQEAQIRFVDGTTQVFDAIILATGYELDLRQMLQQSMNVLDASGRPKMSGAPGSTPGLYFCSYTASPDGQLYQTGVEAQAIAADVARIVQSSAD